MRGIISVSMFLTVAVVTTVLLLRDEGNEAAAAPDSAGRGEAARVATDARLGGIDARFAETVSAESAAIAHSFQETNGGLARLPPGNPKPAHILKAQREGALARITFLVVDDEGRPVPDATIAGGFYNHGRGSHGFSRQTGADGTVTLEDLCVWEVNFHADKTGYYETRSRHDFYKAGFDCVKDGRWIPWNPTVEVVLKRKVNPVAMFVKPRLHKVVPPKQNSYLGYDLQMADFVSPYGRGTNTDFCLKYKFEKGESLLFYRSSVSIVFTNHFDGIYKALLDKSSAFATDYDADTNATYATKMAFEYDRLHKKIELDTRLKKNEYLVLRVRSIVDRNGNLSAANYAKISEFMEADMGGVWFTSYFNPETNNTSLEADTSRNLLNPRDLGFPP